MLGDDEQSLYVVFMGTKHMRDLLSDANFLQEAVWKSKDPDKQQQVISTSLHSVKQTSPPESYLLQCLLIMQYCMSIIMSQCCQL